LVVNRSKKVKDCVCLQKRANTDKYLTKIEILFSNDDETYVSQGTYDVELASNPVATFSEPYDLVLASAVTARFVRITVVTYFGFPCIRAGVLLSQSQCQACPAHLESSPGSTTCNKLVVTRAALCPGGNNYVNPPEADRRYEGTLNHQGADSRLDSSYAWCMLAWTIDR